VSETPSCRGRDRLDRVGARVGTAGWSYRDWNGVVYPAKRPRGFDELAYLAERFDVIEINSTFYRPATPAVAAKWAERVAHLPAFTFTAKLHRDFTHAPAGAPWDGAGVRTFLDGIAPLEAAGRLDALLVQFPWHFRDAAAGRERLDRIRDAFGDGRDLVVELRHDSWTRPEPLEWMEARELSLCSIDLPRASTTPPPVAFVTGPICYLRLHGRNADAWFSREAGRDAKYDYRYSDEELAGWIDRLRAIEDRVRTIYVIANNHFVGQAAANALQIQARLTGRRVPIPESLVARYPDLAEIDA
jgi:uncharacterized protein YecE (DUF72 family)